MSIPESMARRLDTPAATGVFFTVVILTRNLLETAVMSVDMFIGYHVILHHFFWYTFIFLYYAACFRYIAGLSIRHVHRLAWAAPVVFVPLIHAGLAGQRLRLDYLRGSFTYVTRQMFTLMYDHPVNRFFFWELLILSVGIPLVAFIISRSAARSFFTAVIAMTGSMIVGGLHIVGKAPSRFAYIAVPVVGMSEQRLMSHVYYGAAVVMFLLLLMPELLSGRPYISSSLVFPVAVFSIGAVLLVLPIFV